MTNSHSVLWFSEIHKEDVGIAGGKGANLGEMTHAGFPVPDGFVVTSNAYFHYLRENNLAKKIADLLTTVHYEHTDSLSQVSSHIKKMIMQGEMSERLIHEINTAYMRLGGTFHHADVAVRSSATAEDLPTASFAGQQETYLNVHGDANLIHKIREAWASLFEPRAIFYRHEKKFDHFRVGIAVVVQKMIESEKSGVMFTIDPVTNDKSKVVVEAIYGLGELIVQGQVTPDHFEVNKEDMTIVNKMIAKQDVMLTKTKNITKEIKVAVKDQGKQKITDLQAIALAEIGKKLEKHYYFPQDIEWAIEKDKIYIVQTRAITTANNKIQVTKDDHALAKLPLLVKGAPASPGIATGPVKIIHSAKEINKVFKGDILVAPQTNPDYVPAMKKAAAIVTDKGGRTSHAAIVSRELGIPAVVGTEKATTTLRSGMIVTVNGAKGEIYKGAGNTSGNWDEPAAYHGFIKTATRVYVNLAQPDLVEKIAKEHVDGVGLLRAEFMMADIGVHPKKMIRDGKRQEYINKLADQLSIFCKAFNPRPVVYRTSDFKTNEYRNLA